MPGVFCINVAAQSSHFLPARAVEEIQRQIFTCIQAALDQPIETQLCGVVGGEVNRCRDRDGRVRGRTVHLGRVTAIGLPLGRREPVVLAVFHPQSVPLTVLEAVGEERVVNRALRKNNVAVTRVASAEVGPHSDPVARRVHGNLRIVVIPRIRRCVGVQRCRFGPGFAGVHGVRKEDIRI